METFPFRHALFWLGTSIQASDPKSTGLQVLKLTGRVKLNFFKRGGLWLGFYNACAESWECHQQGLFNVWNGKKDKVIRNVFLQESVQIYFIWVIDIMSTLCFRLCLDANSCIRTLLSTTHRRHIQQTLKSASNFWVCPDAQMPAASVSIHSRSCYRGSLWLSFRKSWPVILPFATWLPALQPPHTLIMPKSSKSAMCNISCYVWTVTRHTS